MSDTNDFDFSSIVVAEKAVVLPGGKSYTIREASGAAVAKWRNAQLANAQFDAEGKMTRAGSLGDLPVLLVGECLFDGNNQKASPAVVQGIPDKILSKLYEWLLKASDLEGTANKTNEEATAEQEELKNS